MSNYTIYSLSLANYLVRQGHDIIQVIDSPTDPTHKLKAFIFKNTTELQINMSNFTKYNKEKNYEKQNIHLRNNL